MKIYENIYLDENIQEPKYIQLYEALKSLIEERSIRPNDKMPTIRGLAKKLNVNTVTVVNAYKLLEQKGYIYTKVGSGTFVADKLNNNKINFFSENTFESSDEESQDNEKLINFSTLTPGKELFPVKDFKAVLDEVLERDGADAFTYIDAQGYKPLRKSVSDYLKECGIDSDFSNISIISGAQQGIDLVSKVLIEFNDSVVVESPTYTGAAAIFKNRGANIIEVSIREDGIDINELEEVLKKQNVKLIYVMPNFQNPTGITYSIDKKLALINLAQKYNAFILEDDFLTEINFNKKGVVPLKALDFCDRVIYIKSFSKIFMPGIRLAVLVSPFNISRNMILAKQNTDISSSGLLQRAFDLYIREGLWDKYIKDLNNIYQNRYKKMRDELIKIGDFSFEEPHGGIHFWVKSNLNPSILVYEAKKNGVLIAPGRAFYLDNRECEFFRISFAQVNENEIIKGIDKIREIFVK
ncbi:2-aminoadipate transaminase [Caloramator mitchellensis]|uniref:2-aminoadipate transaminase n=1 Tax=Caloramator mitchellensis TaxID=908809 RepID=A0A0R3JV73_CALMK|nr:PLP-dependent aminotransferase family protein [Caloramator mitchellensis]KRQ87497.1 2-aminoadipate transaminase [Caloramator mitchellensis]